MFLKDFPEDFTLGYSVHVLSILLQSILIRAQQQIEGPASVMSPAEIIAFENLVDLLQSALSDATSLQKRLMN